MKKWLDNCFICGLKLKYLKFNSPLCVRSSLLKCTRNDRNQQVANPPTKTQFRDRNRKTVREGPERGRNSLAMAYEPMDGRCFLRPMKGVIV